ncbi:MAG TPA: hypothetical protein VGG36_10990 [Rhizomicrobium sp.]
MTTRAATGSGIVPYQAYSDKAKCPAPQACTVTFPAITGTGVFIQHVSCVFEIKTGADVAYAEIESDGQSGFNMLSTNKLTAAGGGFLYAANAQTDLFIDAGAAAQIVIVATGKKMTGMVCTISGFHV